MKEVEHGSPAFDLFDRARLTSGAGDSGAAPAGSYPYVLIDLGTFGGPNSYLDLPGQTMNGRGAVIGSADTSTSDPFAPNCINQDCFAALGFVWQRGCLTSLASLPGGASSGAISITANGLIAGFSQHGAIAPVTSFPEFRAVLW
jgi:hypothetical protein